MEIAGSELTNREAAQVFSRVLGKPVKFRKLPLPLVRLFLGRQFCQMFRWFSRAGFQANIVELRRRYPEVHLQTLEEGCGARNGTSAPGAYDPHKDDAAHDRRGYGSDLCAGRSVSADPVG